VHNRIYKGIDQNLISFSESLKNVIFEMRKYKSQHCLSMKDGMDALEIRTEQRFAEWFRQSEMDIKACSNAGRINCIFV